MNRSFRDFSELFMKVNGDHMSIKRDYKGICSSIEKVYQEINIYNMQKYLDDKVVELSVLRTGYMKKVKEWLTDNYFTFTVCNLLKTPLIIFLPCVSLYLLAKFTASSHATATGVSKK